MSLAIARIESPWVYKVTALAFFVQAGHEE